MFRFLFRRAQQIASPQADPPSVVPDAGSDRQAALAKARSLGGHEEAALAFLLECPFADARLIAAEAIRAPDHLEQVRQAMRDTDRRVARLMQSRLEESTRRADALRHAGACVDDAHVLLRQSRLLASDVAAVDRRWNALQGYPDTIEQAFETVRGQLAARLLAQTELQRRLIELTDRLSSMAADLGQTDENAPDRLVLESLSAEVDACRVSQEALSVPASLFSACDAALSRAHAMAEAASVRTAARVRCVATLAKWEQTEVSLLDAAAIRREWSAMQHAGDETCETRFNSLLLRIKAVRAATSAPAPAALPATDALSSGAESNPSRLQAFDDALAALDDALSSGMLQTALAQDRIVRSLGMAAARDEPDRAARLAASRAQLARLQGWARWGGNVSRDELLRAALELPDREKDLHIVAERVTDLRRRWKALDRSAGLPAGHVWEQFDAACNAAYAPAAAYFAAQAAERDANRARAQQLIARTEAFAQECGIADEAIAGWKAVNWKEVAKFCRKAEQEWQQIGPVGRRDKKSIQAAFESALANLQGPLSRAQQHSAEEREAMIAEVLAIDPVERYPAGILRRIQERWQDNARMLPLPGNLEHQLWQRFRAACDAVHSRRQADIDTTRKAQQRSRDIRQALCERLESVTEGSPEAIAGLLNETALQWVDSRDHGIAPDRALDGRYRTAVAALQQRLDGAAREKGASLWKVLQEQLVLCREAEKAVLGQGTDRDDALARRLRAEWDRLPLLHPFVQQAMQRRFEAALAGQDSNASHGAALRAGEPVLLQEILRLEILAGIESPPALSKERLRLQVDMLQSALKNGRGTKVVIEQLASVCGLAALTNDQTARRLDRVLHALGKSHPVLLAAS